MPRTKKVSYGGCQIGKISPDKPNYPRVINVLLSFEEGLKLNMALDECLRQLNSYNRATREGKRASVVIAVKPDLGSIDIVEGKI
jgi:hypothetical protein